MSLFGFFKQKKSAAKVDECVLIILDGSSLPDEIYQQYDLSTLEDQLIEVIGKNGVGELDGNETGPMETTIYTYGPDADRLYEIIEPVLVTYPLCENARVVIRHGGPGAPQTEHRIQVD